MNSKQLNRRQVISLSLAILILVAAATPVLAWFDEGGENFQTGQTMSTGRDAAGSDSVADSAVSEYPVGLQRAEGW